MDNKIYKEELIFLRSNTVLGPISLLKLEKLREEIIKARELFYKLEGCLIDFDYSSLEQLEYELRFEAWKNRCMNLWLINPDGLSLSEFAEIAMEQQMAREKMFQKKKVRK